MKTKSGSTNQKPSALCPRTVLCVDDDKLYESMLHDAWLKLHLADDLHIVRSPAEALERIHPVHGKNGDAPLAGIVLDPEVTGEATGSFLRDVRSHCTEEVVPIVLWSWDRDKYKVLEGRGVDSVIHKPMILRLIQALDATCHLRVHHFRPFIVNNPFEHASPQSNVGVYI